MVRKRTKRSKRRGLKTRNRANRQRGGTLTSSPFFQDAYAVTLDPESKRYVDIKNFASAAGVPLQPWKGVLIKPEEKDTLPPLGIGTTHFKDRTGAVFNLGVIGAYLGHRNLLEHVAKTAPEKPGTLIFEDDVSLTSSLDTLYHTLLNLPKQYDVCHIGLSDWYPFIKTEKINAFFYRPYKRFFNRLTAYVVSKRGAKKMTEYSNGFINYPADDLLSEIYLRTNDFDLYVPETYLFQERENNHSIIGIVNDSTPLNSLKA
jgi:GR25 family glycosyltransferase involved in LPS biosynthesis